MFKKQGWFSAGTCAFFYKGSRTAIHLVGQPQCLLDLAAGYTTQSANNFWQWPCTVRVCQNTNKILISLQSQLKPFGCFINLGKMRLDKIKGRILNKVNHNPYGQRHITQFQMVQQVVTTTLTVILVKICFFFPWESKTDIISVDKKSTNRCIQSSFSLEQTHWKNSN